MSFEKVLRRFKLISDIPDNELEVWKDVVAEAMDFISSLIKARALSESDKTRLNNAAAVYAYYKYACYTDDSEGSFKAGDISVSSNGKRLENAREMWLSEKNAIADLTVSSDFVFGRIL